MQSTFDDNGQLPIPAHDLQKKNDKLGQEKTKAMKRNKGDTVPKRNQLNKA